MGFVSRLSVPSVLFPSFFAPQEASQFQEPSRRRLFLRLLFPFAAHNVISDVFFLNLILSQSSSIDAIPPSKQSIA